MKLLNSEKCFSFEFEENRINTIVIENPHSMTECIVSLSRQCEGEPGDYFVSDGESMENIVEDAMIIRDIIGININEKKYISKLHASILNSAGELLEEKEIINNKLINIIDKMIEMTPFTEVEYDTELDFQTILKIYSVRFEDYYDSICEKIVALVRMAALLLHKKIVFFVNLKTYLSTEEIKQIVEFAGYYHIAVILLENMCGCMDEKENFCIIDKDECLIY